MRVGYSAYCRSDHCSGRRNEQSDPRSVAPARTDAVRSHERVLPWETANRVKFARTRLPEIPERVTTNSQARPERRLRRTLCRTPNGHEFAARPTGGAEHLRSRVSLPIQQWQTTPLHREGLSTCPALQRRSVRPPVPLTCGTVVPTWRRCRDCWTRSSAPRHGANTASARLCRSRLRWLQAPAAIPATSRAPAYV